MRAMDGMSRSGGGGGADRRRSPAVILVDREGSAAREHPPLRRAVRVVLSGERWERPVELVLVSGREMRRLNRDFHGVDATTDVLSFRFEEGTRGTGGAIVVSVPRARAQARSRGKSWRSELVLYAVHGALHLAGYDDRTGRDRRRMRARERRWLAALGFLGPDAR